MNIKELTLNGVSKLNEFNIDDSTTKVRILLSSLLNVSKEKLLIMDEEVDEKLVERFNDNINKLIKGVPVQYLVNKQSFYGMDFFVDNRVLIPQPDTECLVEEGLEFLKGKENAKVLDLCTGSGAIAISIAKNSDATIYASDISKDALDVAKLNATTLSADITFIESDLLKNINEKFDLIISNPPYIKTDVIELLSDEVKNEPILALDGKEDGLYFYKEIIKNAKGFLNPNGKLLFEIGFDQKESVTKLFEEEEYINVYSKKDLAGLDRIVSGEKKGE
ncbi:MAG: peptide chain release factor N(5)-glutamine methyltransferase [Clostridia bacterium]|nr:peptide chain release factor N(5)-glutamine methyltransferase [Clostridia bacterium]